MIRRYCDICGKELQAKDMILIEEQILLGVGLARGDRHFLFIKIMTGLESKYQSGDFHHVCILRKLTEHFIEKSK